MCECICLAADPAHHTPPIRRTPRLYNDGCIKHQLACVYPLPSHRRRAPVRLELNKETPAHSFIKLTMRNAVCVVPSGTVLPSSGKCWQQDARQFMVSNTPPLSLPSCLLSCCTSPGFHRAAEIGRRLLSWTAGSGQTRFGPAPFPHRKMAGKRRRLSSHWRF